MRALAVCRSPQLMQVTLRSNCVMLFSRTIFFCVSFEIVHSEVGCMPGHLTHLAVKLQLEEECPNLWQLKHCVIIVFFFTSNWILWFNRNCSFLRDETSLSLVKTTVHKEVCNLLVTNREILVTVTLRLSASIAPFMSVSSKEWSNLTLFIQI